MAESKSGERLSLLGANSTGGKGRKPDKLTGIVGGELPLYTEQPLGGAARSRLASYDSATALGLPRVVSSRVRLESWEFPGWGSHFKMEAPAAEILAIEAHQSAEKPKLGEWSATAICGNDILSSVLYVSGLVTTSAGWLSPFCLLVVAGMLYLYRYIYAEAVSALPMNGGSYNVLINTASKAVASFAACLAIISYTATGVVSASTAIAYLQTLLPGIDAVWCTLGLLFFFACLTAMGIAESARMAIGIFVLHIFTLAALCLLAGAYALSSTATFRGNIERGFPDVVVAGDVVHGTWLTAMLFGVSGAMLGVSGFESSSQFVEEQAPGVFVRTLRNMWMGVAIFNPVICLLSFCVLPLDEIAAHQHSMLAHVARRVGYWAEDRLGWSTQTNLALWLEAWVSLDAFVVLSGAVLTAYVGITGLVRRMAKDRCLPQFLLRTNKWRGTNHYIIFGFFFLATSQVWLLHGDVGLLAGVYTFAFLGVMSIFSVGCMVLKFKRPSLPREETVSYGTIAAALCCVLTAFVGNMLGKPEILTWFGLYLLVVGGFILLVFQRIRLLKLVISIMAHYFPGATVRSLKEHVLEIQNVPMVFFCKYDDLYVINKAILYVRENEQTQKLVVVHCSQDPESQLVRNLSKHIEMFDHIYPKLKISLLTVTGTFSPACIEWLSQELGVAKNMMFISCPDALFKYKISHLGGVRVITH